MRILIIIISMITILGCKQSSKEESQNFEEKERWFFWSADWHPAKSKIVVGGSNDTFFKLISSTDYGELKSYPYKGTITKTKWHPTKNKLAVSVQDGKSKSIIINLDNDETIQLDTITNDGARAIGWNHSGDLLAIGDYEGFLTIFDEQGNVLQRKNTNQKGIIGLDWHPDENLIVAVGEKITLYNYKLDSLRNIDDVDDRSKEIDVLMLCVDWHPNGEFFVTGDYGDFQKNYRPLLQYWTYDGKRIKSIDKSEAEIRNMKWSNDGDLLATASEKIRLWNKNGDLVAEKTTKNLLQGIDWNADATKLITTDDKRKVIFWDRNLNRLKELQY
ncbi:WD40 repeat domain-containing protein [uncultured Aquimarina sp.]|uniref:WD40 repeat domain-containing protein n=2 Tax=uncultured Aquimarina sp. TaxID=575652 RepID=UPI0026016C7C|nr:WD40 repeat domain-containing protein [uncultured Aquimarina sp.]